MFKKKVLTHYVLASPTDELMELVQDWIEYGSYEGVDEEIEDLLQKHPELRKSLDKGMETKTLYRGFSLAEHEMERLLKDSIKSLKKFESWSKKESLAKDFAYPEHQCAGLYGVLFKRDVPEKQRLLYVPKNEDTAEEEVICYDTTYTRDDMHKIFFKTEDCKLKQISLEEAKNLVKTKAGSKLEKLSKCC